MAKQAAEVDTLLSNGSPSLVRRPTPGGRGLIQCTLQYYYTIPIFGSGSSVTVGGPELPVAGGRGGGQSAWFHIV